MQATSLLHILLICVKPVPPWKYGILLLVLGGCLSTYTSHAQPSQSVQRVALDPNGWYLPPQPIDLQRCVKALHGVPIMKSAKPASFGIEEVTKSFAPLRLEIIEKQEPLPLSISGSLTNELVSSPQREEGQLQGQSVISSSMNTSPGAVLPAGPQESGSYVLPVQPMAEVEAVENQEGNIQAPDGGWGYKSAERTAGFGRETENEGLIKKLLKGEWLPDITGILPQGLASSRQEPQITQPQPSITQQQPPITQQQPQITQQQPQAREATDAGLPVAEDSAPAQVSSGMPPIPYRKRSSGASNASVFGDPEDRINQLLQKRDLSSIPTTIYQGVMLSIFSVSGAFFWGVGLWKRRWYMVFAVLYFAFVLGLAISAAFMSSNTLGILCVTVAFPLVASLLSQRPLSDCGACFRGRFATIPVGWFLSVVGSGIIVGNTVFILIVSFASSILGYKEAILNLYFNHLISVCVTYLLILLVLMSGFVLWLTVSRIPPQKSFAGIISLISAFATLSGIVYVLNAVWLSGPLTDNKPTTPSLDNRPIPFTPLTFYHPLTGVGADYRFYICLTILVLLLITGIILQDYIQKQTMQFEAPQYNTDVEDEGTSSEEDDEEPHERSELISSPSPSLSRKRANKAVTRIYSDDGSSHGDTSSLLLPRVSSSISVTEPTNEVDVP